MQIALLALSILLILIIAVQEPSEAGLGSLFGGGSNDLSGRKWLKNTKESKLKKLTVVLIIAIAVLSIIALIVA